MGYFILAIAVFVFFVVLIIIGAIISGVIGLITHAAPGMIMRLIARKDVQSLSETAKENEGFAPPQGSEVNEDCYD